MPPLIEEVCQSNHSNPAELSGLGLRNTSSPIAKAQMESRPKDKKKIKKGGKKEKKGTALSSLGIYSSLKNPCKLPWHMEPDTQRGNVPEVCSAC